jgi:hypothetical protein
MVEWGRCSGRAGEDAAAHVCRGAFDLGTVHMTGWAREVQPARGRRPESRRRRLAAVTVVTLAVASRLIEPSRLAAAIRR